MSQPTSTPSDLPSDYLDSPGRRLRALRQSRGLDIERVAAQLHLERQVVEDLERDRFEDLPSPVFIAGYLRNYARLLGADPTPIVEAYRALGADQDSSQARPPSKTTRPPSPRRGTAWTWVLALGLAVIAVVMIALWWKLQGQPSPEMTPGESDGTAQESLVSPPTSSDPSSAEAGGAGEAPQGTAPVDSFGSTVSVPSDTIPLRPSATPSSSTGAGGSVTSTSTSTSTGVDAIPAASLPTETAQTPDSAPATSATPEVILQFSGTSWVDVRDASGNVVLNGEMRQGDRRALTGKPPFKLVIGNAAATQMTVGAQPFDLANRAQGNVARFTLDPSSSTPATDE